MIITTLPARQRGMTLAEMMISVVLGLIVTYAITTLFLNTSRGNKENSDITMMQENARFAMELIAEDLRHAGFAGNIQNPADIDQTGGVTMPANTDCEGTMLDFSSSADMLGYDTGLTAAEVATKVLPCTLTGTLPTADNTLLVIKRTSTTLIPYASAATLLQPGHIYVHSNGGVSVLGNGSATSIPLSTGSQIWEYTPRIYYITNTHTLYRNIFEGSWRAEALAEGIERFNIEFGIDDTTDTDAAPNYFTDAPTAAERNNIVSARVHVLARTSVPDANYEDTNDYVLGSVTVTPTTDTNNTDPNKTHYHRNVYSTTVTIPNLRIRRLSNN